MFGVAEEREEADELGMRWDVREPDALAPEDVFWDSNGVVWTARGDDMVNLVQFEGRQLRVMKEGQIQNEIPAASRWNGTWHLHTPSRLRGIVLSDNR